jgi:hypothetical protein
MAGLAAPEPIVALWVPWCRRCDAPMTTMTEPGFEGRPPSGTLQPIRVCRACGDTVRVMHVPWVATG